MNSLANRFNPFNTYFSRIYVVTCHDFVDRHELALRNLRDNGIVFDFVFSPPASSLATKPPLKQTEHSLVLGHLQCLLNAKLNQLDRIAIWEDDGTLIASFDQIKEFLQNVPNDWECLYMGNADWSDDIWPIERWPVSQAVCKSTWGTGSSFNGIRHVVYDQLIAGFLRQDTPADRVYYEVFGRGKTYSPAKGYFSNPISEPHELHVHKFKDSNREFLKSRISHSS